MLMGKIASYVKKKIIIIIYIISVLTRIFTWGTQQPLLLENRGLGGKEGRQSDQ